MMTSLHECSWTGPSSGIVFLGGGMFINNNINNKLCILIYLLILLINKFKKIIIRSGMG